jgi:hypothetical protein
LEAVVIVFCFFIQNFASYASLPRRDLALNGNGFLQPIRKIKKVSTKVSLPPLPPPPAII